MLKIYNDCNHLIENDGDCWNCNNMDLCSGCKINGCTNEEKENVISEMRNESTLGGMKK